MVKIGPNDETTKKREPKSVGWDDRRIWGNVLFLGNLGNYPLKVENPPNCQITMDALFVRVYKAKDTCCVLPKPAKKSSIAMTTTLQRHNRM